MKTIINSKNNLKSLVQPPKIMASSSSDQAISDFVHLLISSSLLSKESERNWAMNFNKQDGKVECLRFNNGETEVELFLLNKNHFRLIDHISNNIFLIWYENGDNGKSKQEVLKACIPTCNLWVTRSLLPIDLIDDTKLSYSNLNELVIR